MGIQSPFKERTMRKKTVATAVFNEVKFYVSTTFVIETADDFFCNVRPLEVLEYVEDIDEDGDEVLQRCHVQEFCRTHKISHFKLGCIIADQNSDLVWEMLCKPRHGSVIMG
jgi:hypothetical protein